MTSRCRCVDARIRMRPRVRQRPGVERAHQRLHILEFQQPRAPRNQQPDRQLNGRDVIDQIQVLQACRADRSSRRA